MNFAIGGQRYPRLADALAALRDGQTLDIDPGLYPDDCGNLRASDATVQCIGGRAIFGSICDGKAALNVFGNRNTIRGIGGENLHAFYDGNGGVIRMEGESITVIDLYAVKCDMPYLSGLRHPNSVEKFIRPYIRKTKTVNPVIDPIGHGLYFGVCAEAWVIDPDIEGDSPGDPPNLNIFGYGHLVKSRGRKTVIQGGRLIKGPYTSRVLDQTGGGIVRIEGNVVVKTSPGDRRVIGFGGEAWIDANGNPVDGSFNAAVVNGVPQRGPRFPGSTINIDPRVVIDDGSPPPPAFLIQQFIPAAVTFDRITTPGDTDMPKVTMFADAGIEFEMHEGPPPSQQEVDALKAQVAALTAKIEVARAAAQAEQDADDANRAGKGVLDALG